MKKITLLSAILITACTFCYGQLIDCKEPFISEMIEGTANNKAIEIFNPSDSAVDLDSLSIRLFKDGSVTPDIIQLNGTLAAKSKFVIAHPSANTDIISKADMLDAQLDFDGNDAIVVRKSNGTEVDKIGEVGVDPGSSGWTCTSGTTKNQTLRRKSTFGKGELDWQQCRQQWDDFPVDNSDDLKQHSGGCGATCNTAIAETANSTCIFTTYTTNGQETWFEFTATNPDVQISVISEAFGTNTPHVHNISLFSGTCGSLNRIAQDELPFIAIANDLTIDASGLVVGDIYHVRTNVLATAAACSRTACPGTAVVSFALCIQDIDVSLPFDFNLISFGVAETPSLDHVYYSSKGQIVDTDGNPRRDIVTYTLGNNPNVYVMDDKISYVFSKVDTDTTLTYRVDMSLNGANTGLRAFKTGKVSNHLNYYKGHIPSGITNMEGYAKIVCNDVYPNIDMQYYSNSEGMKIYFIVHPGGDPTDIEFQYTGATGTNINSLGHLEVETPIGKMEQDFGHTFMIDSSGNISPLLWNAQYKLMGNDRVRFKIQNYPTNLPLVIQIDQGHKPLAAGGPIRNLEHSTFLGGDFDDWGIDVQTDNTGNVYVTGITASSDFPTTPGALDTTLSNFTGMHDAFVTKFDPLGELLWSTYYGGNASEFSVSLVVSQDGHIYFAGYTRSTDFPTGDNTGTSPYFQDYMDDVHPSAEEGFIVGLNTDGTLYWATYFGGNTNDEIHKITEDNAGNLLISGEVAFLSTGPGDTIRMSNVPCLPSPSPDNEGFPICDPGGGAFYDEVHGGFLGQDQDGFIAKFNPSRQLIYSTLLGGNQLDEILDLIVDPTDDSYFITGSTSSGALGNNPCGVPSNAGFPRCDPGGGAYYDSIYTGGTDAFIGKFSSQGVLLWMTFFGSNVLEVGHHMALDGNGNLYLVGRGTVNFTTSFTDNLCGVPGNAGFPLCDPGGGALFNPKTGVGIAAHTDMFIAKFNPSGQLTWSTYVGGDGNETGSFFIGDDGVVNIAIDGDNRVYILGNTSLPFSGVQTIDTLELGGFYYQPINQSNGGFFASDAYIAAFGSDSSELLWATHFGTPETDGSGEFGHGITIDQANKQLYVTGATKQQFFPTACPPTSPNPYCDDVISGSYDAYLARFNIDFILTGIEESTIENAASFILYPNPTSGNVMVSFNLKQRSEIDVKLYSAVGQLLSSERLKVQTGQVDYELNLDNISTGIYMITVEMDNEVIGKKFIKL